MLLINNQTVEKILDMKGCLESLEVGYRDLAGQRAAYRGRIDMFVPNDDPKLMYRWGSMEGASRSFETFAIRVKSDMLEWPEGKTVEKYCVEPGTYCGLVLVFSTRNGEPLAIINDGVIQHMRVGGCAGLGAKYLARDDATTVGMIGSGGMARSYLTAFKEVRDIREAKVYSPSREHREAYAREMSGKLNLKVTPVESIQDAIHESDIVAACTDSIQPLVEDPSWIAEGMHLTCVKPLEWGPRVVTSCDLVVRMGYETFDNPEQGTRRIGGMAALIAGSEAEATRIANPGKDTSVRGYPFLTDILAGKLPGRTDKRQKSLHFNEGTQGLQFASTAGYIVREALRRKLGQEIPTSWFLQDIRD
jgi:alanine dehydrogenase